MLNIDESLKRIKRKYDKKIDISPLLEYEKDKKKDPELEKKLIKKIEKISD
jgi:hypothetical protein